MRGGCFDLACGVGVTQRPLISTATREKLCSYARERSRAPFCFAKNEGKMSAAGLVRNNLTWIYSLTGIFLLGYISSMQTATLVALAEPNRLRIVELLRD